MLLVIFINRISKNLRQRDARRQQRSVATLAVSLTKGVLSVKDKHRPHSGSLLRA